MIETYVLTGLGRGIHTDNLEYIGSGDFDSREIDTLPFDENGEADVDINLMGKEEYESTVLANSSVKAFPNPATHQFSVNYSVEQPATLTIVDMQGRTVRSMPVEGNGTVNISDLPAGMYAYGIAGGKMQKLIVK